VANTADSREEHFHQTVTAGKFLNDQKLLRILVDQAFDRVRSLEDFGVPLLYEDPYFYVLGDAPFYGLKMISPLQKAANNWGVSSLPHTVALDLLKVNDTICGVLAYDFSKDTLLIIPARATILATGGAGALYPLHDNSPRTTGDGFAIAARAGALIRDMEFVQFYPLGLVEGDSFRCVVPPFLGDSAPIRNAQGEDILAKYRIGERPAAVKARDALCQAMFREILAGRGFGTYLEIDLTRVPQEEWDQNRQLSHYRKILQEKYRGRERPLKIAPVCHHFMGGVVIDETSHTNLRGLFAAGEVTGGLHGANRMGGNALSECVVFGALAGPEASQYARRTGAYPFAKGLIRKREKQILLWREANPNSSRSPQEFKKRLAEIMFAKVGIIRKGEQLEQARRELESLAEQAQVSMSCQNPKDVLQAIEVINLITTSRLVLHGALRRTESRGSHYREDYPETDDRRWRLHLLSEGEMT
jgi:succinate dehydrogenase/fumarate reductase flavoprotein subunit